MTLRISGDIVYKKSNSSWSIIISIYESIKVIYHSRGKTVMIGPLVMEDAHF